MNDENTDTENVIEEPVEEPIENASSPEFEEEPEERNSIARASIAPAISGAAIVDNYRIKISNVRTVEQMGGGMDVVQDFSVKSLENLLETAEKEAEVAMRNPRLTDKQIKNIRENIDTFKTKLSSIGENDVDIFKAYMKLCKNIPDKVLKQIEALDPKIMEQIAKLLGEQALVGKSVDQIEATLKTIVHNEDTAKALASVFVGKNQKQIVAMTETFSMARNAKKVFQVVKSSLILDVAFLGFDIWLWNETMNEADLIAKVNEIRAQNKRNQADFQLYVGMAIVAAPLVAMGVGAAIGSAVGPIGTVVGLAA
jgi:hypothetical protein